MAKTIIRGMPTRNPRRPTSSSHMRLRTSSRAKVFWLSRSILDVRLSSSASPLSYSANSTDDYPVIVILESNLMSKVTNEMFAEGHKIATGSLNGKGAAVLSAKHEHLLEKARD